MLSRDDDLEKLYAQIPRENLPEKLGGHMKPDIAWKKDLAKKAMQVFLTLLVKRKLRTSC